MSLIFYSPFPFLSNSSAVAVKNTSPLLLRAVSTESWTTPMMAKTVLYLLHSLGVDDADIRFDNFGG